MTRGPGDRPGPAIEFGDFKAAFERFREGHR